MQQDLPSGETDVGESALRQRLVWWLAMAGLVVGVGEALLAIPLALLWWFGEWPDTNQPLAVGWATTTTAAGVLLLVGSLALLRQKAWARPLLLTYAWLKIGMVMIAYLLPLAYQMMRPDVFESFRSISFLLNSAHSFILQSFFPAVILVCLLKLRLFDPVASRRSGFEIISTGRTQSEGGEE